MQEYIKNRVHELYWNDDINCARTVIICLGELFEIAIEQQTIWSAVGLHGAGGYRAQCGIVEGTIKYNTKHTENGELIEMFFILYRKDIGSFGLL